MTCSHCLKKFTDKQLTPPLQEEIAKKEVMLGNKKPAWHSCGCMVILLVAFSTLVFTCAQKVFGDDDEPAEEELANEPYKKLYEADIKNLTSDPDPGKDSISFGIKQYIDMVVTDEMGKSGFKYFSKIKGNRVLVVMEVPDMKKVAAEERSTFLSLIREALDVMDYKEGKQLYIVVEGTWNTVLVSTPTHSDYEGHFADIEYVYDFYKPVLLKEEFKEVKAGDTTEAQL